MKREITWKLQSGKVATYTIELVTSEGINLDGDITTVPVAEVRSQVSIPGAGFIPSPISERKSLVNGVEYVAIIGGKVAITEDVYSQIKEARVEIEAHPAWVKRVESEKAADAAEVARYAARVKSGWCEKCGSYCHGEC